MSRDSEERSINQDTAARKYDRSKVEENDRRIVEGVEKHTRPVGSAARIDDLRKEAIAWAGTLEHAAHIDVSLSLGDAAELAVFLRNLAEELSRV